MIHGTEVESISVEPVVVTAGSDLEFLDQGEQTELAHVPDPVRPRTFWFVGPPAVLSEEGVVKMWDGGGVPGATGHGACQEAAGVVDEIGDDHIDDLLGKFGDGGRVCSSGNLLRGTHVFPDPSSASAPNSLSDLPNRCREN